MITDQKFYLPRGLTNGQGSLPVAITARIRQSGRLLMSKPDSCEITRISKSDQRFLRTRFFKNFFMSVLSKKPPFHQSHIYRQITILPSIFEKGHPRNIQNLTSSFGEKKFLRISSCPYNARSLHSPEPCLWTDQNFATKF